MIEYFNDIKPERLFIILGVIFGLLFVFITPPFQVNDEPAHYYKAYSISDGQLIPQKAKDQVAYYLPQSLLSTVETFSFMIFHPDKKMPFNAFYKSLFKPLKSDNRILIYNEATLAYPPLSYLAPGLSMFIGKILGLSPLILMYLGRLTNLFVWLILVFTAIKLTPVHKKVFLLLALMPMTVFQAASLSADSFSLGLSFFTIAYYLYLSIGPKENIENKDVLILLALMLLLSLAKQGYAILMLLFLIIPSNKFTNQKKRIKSFLTIIIPPLFVTGMWNYLFKDLATSPWVSTGDQLAFIGSNIPNFLNILINSLISQFQVYIITFVGIFGWMENSLPGVVVLIYILALIIVALTEIGDFEISIKQKIVFLSICVITVIFTLVYEYLTFTPLANNLVLGVQGRYFIPIAPLLFLILYRKIPLKIKNIELDLKKFKYSNIVIVALIVSVSIISLLMQLQRYYMP